MDSVTLAPRKRKRDPAKSREYIARYNALHPERREEQEKRYKLRKAKRRLEDPQYDAYCRQLDRERIRRFRERKAGREAVLCRGHSTVELTQKCQSMSTCPAEIAEPKHDEEEEKVIYDMTENVVVKEETETGLKSEPINCNNSDNDQHSPIFDFTIEVKKESTDDPFIDLISSSSDGLEHLPLSTTKKCQSVDNFDIDTPPSFGFFSPNLTQDKDASVHSKKKKRKQYDRTKKMKQDRAYKLRVARRRLLDLNFDSRYRQQNRERLRRFRQRTAEKLADGSTNERLKEKNLNEETNKLSSSVNKKEESVEDAVSFAEGQARRQRGRPRRQVETGELELGEVRHWEMDVQVVQHRKFNQCLYESNQKIYLKEHKKKIHNKICLGHKTKELTLKCQQLPECPGQLN